MLEPDVPDRSETVNPIFSERIIAAIDVVMRDVVQGSHCRMSSGRAWDGTDACNVFTFTVSTAPPLRKHLRTLKRSADSATTTPQS